MNDDIIKWAREAGLYHFYDSEGHCSGITDARLVNEDQERCDDRLVEMLAPFAKLVAAQERERIKKSNAPVIKTINEHIKALEEARKAEREACAKVCDARHMGDNNREDMEARRCAAAIRARGNT